MNIELIHEYDIEHSTSDSINPLHPNKKNSKKRSTSSSKDRRDPLNLSMFVTKVEIKILSRVFLVHLAVLIIKVPNELK